MITTGSWRLTKVALKTMYVYTLHVLYIEDVGRGLGMSNCQHAIVVIRRRRGWRLTL